MAALVQTPLPFSVIEADEYESLPAVTLVGAVRSRDLPGVQTLLEAHSDLTRPSVAGLAPPLIEALCAGDAGIVQLLLDRQADLSLRDAAFGGNALHWAAVVSDEDMFEKLLELAAHQLLLDEVTHGEGLTALHVAAAGGRDHAVRALLSSRASPNIASLLGRTALHEAALGGSLGAVEALLAAQALVDAVDRQEETALLGAARRGRLPIVEALAERGAALDRANAAGVTPLMGAAFHGHGPTCDFLLARGADARAHDRAHRRTALHWAAHNDHPEVVSSILVWAGDTLRARDAGGRTPLDLAAEVEAAAALRVLRAL